MQIDTSNNQGQKVGAKEERTVKKRTEVLAEQSLNRKGKKQKIDNAFKEYYA
jgi:hypothetical protein